MTVEQEGKALAYMSEIADTPLFSNSPTTVLEALRDHLSWFANHPSVSKEAFSDMLYTLHNKRQSFAGAGADPGGVRWVRTNPLKLYTILLGILLYSTVTAATELYLSTVATELCLQSIYFYDTFHLRMPLLLPSQ